MKLYEKFEPDRFYSFEDGDFYAVCGQCVIDSLQKSADGTYQGDEITYAEQYELLQDDDTEPYQCEICLKQNDAYDDQYGE